MVGKLKILGSVFLALVAVMSVTGVASASAKLFHAESAPVKVSGTQTTTAKFTTTAGTIECSTASFSGESAEKTTETLTINPVYSGCKFLGFINVVVNFHSCDFIFNANGTAAVGGGAACDGNPISFEAAGCKVTVGASGNTALTSIGYANVGSGTTRTVTVSPNVGNITYTQSSGCPNGASEMSNGTYTGGVTTVKGSTSAGKQQGIWVE